MHNHTLLSSQDIKKILKITDCELMHRREAGQLEFERKGRSFFYWLPDEFSLLDHPLGDQLLNWHKDRHNFALPNNPNTEVSKNFLEKLVRDILIPVEHNFGKLKITYGFTSAKLAAYIAKYSPKGTAPKLDQHAACEFKSNNALISKRSGSACDFIAVDYSMADITRFIVENLDFDRLYYYGDNRPLHVSISDTPVKHLQIMCESSSGRRYPGKKAFGENALILAGSL